MFEARHAAVVAGLGVAGAFSLPRTASAWEGFALSSVLTEMPLLAFGIGIAGGFAVGGVVYAVHRVTRKPAPRAKGKHFAENIAVCYQLSDTQDTTPLLRGSKHMRLDAEFTVPVTGSHARRGKHFAVVIENPAPMSLDARIPSPEVIDYENVAQRYVLNEKQQKSKAIRSRGVAAVLLERMDLQRGFPSIERGVSQLEASESWWSDFEPVSANVTATPAPNAAALPELSIEEKRAIARENAAKRRAAERITRAIPQVDQGMYPELRTVEDIDDGEDLWTMALKAMDDLMPVAAFSDNVGTAETIDEPDGLELPTEFLRSRKREMVPEFYDTSAFIDFIVNDELARSSSDAVRRRSTLKIIEGGTQSTGRLGRHTRPTREIRTSTAGKHFAVAAEA